MGRLEANVHDEFVSQTDGGEQKAGGRTPASEKRAGRVVAPVRGAGRVPEEAARRGRGGAERAVRGSAADQSQAGEGQTEPEDGGGRPGRVGGRPAESQGQEVSRGVWLVWFEAGGQFCCFGLTWLRSRCDADVIRRPGEKAGGAAL